MKQCNVSLTHIASMMLLSVPNLLSSSSMVEVMASDDHQPLVSVEVYLVQRQRYVHVLLSHCTFIYLPTILICEDVA